MEETRRHIDVRLADVGVRLVAPEGVLAVLDATLCVVPRSGAMSAPDLIVSAERKSEVWEIRGAGDAMKVLTAKSAPPQVAGALVTSAVQGVATIRNVKAMRATVLERDGRALAMLGDDWESAITLAAHLHGRGWNFIGSDSAFLDSRTLEVLPIQKLLYVNASAVGQFPVRYRRALEASPWYVTTQGISFYAVDPRHAGSEDAWSSSAVLSAVVVVDGAMTDYPALESFAAVGDGRQRRERFAWLGIDWDRLNVVELRLGGCIETCDLVEHWFASLS